jgi:hypothetical protein
MDQAAGLRKMVNMETLAPPLTARYKISPEYAAEGYISHKRKGGVGMDKHYSKPCGCLSEIHIKGAHP